MSARARAAFKKSLLSKGIPFGALNVVNAIVQLWRTKSTRKTNKITTNKGRKPWFLVPLTPLFKIESHSWFNSLYHYKSSSLSTPKRRLSQTSKSLATSGQPDFRKWRLFSSECPILIYDGHTTGDTGETTAKIMPERKVTKLLKVASPFCIDYPTISFLSIIAIQTTLIYVYIYI